MSNEVAFRRFVVSKHVFVPQVYAYSATSDPDTSYIAEEYIEGIPLSTVWTTFNSSQKDSIAHKVASIVVDLAEIRFPKIGGLVPETFDPAPTVEGSKLLEGPWKVSQEGLLSYRPVRIYERVYVGFFR